MNRRLSLAAPAKINLDLRVLAREDSGYHQIETLFLLVDLADHVVVSETADGIDLRVSGSDLGPTEANLAYRAASAVLEHAGRSAGVRIDLHKHIPAGGGLGGGSSDAAATLRLVNHMLGDPLSDAALLGIGSALGADVPFFLTRTGFALAWGRGDRLLELEPLPHRIAVIVTSELHVSTPEAYRALSADGLPSSGPRAIARSDLGDWSRIAAAAVNQFESVVFGLHPSLARVRDTLAAEGAMMARMSGSGSSVFGIFEDARAANTAAERVSTVHGVRCRVVGTRTGRAEIGVEPDSAPR